MKTFFEDHILHLDLHGVRHHEVKDAVEDFVLTNQNLLPLIIICGNSSKMIEIVNESLKTIDVVFEETRYGRIRVNTLG